MTKFFVMRECDNILSGYLCAMTTVFSQQDGIYGFEFPKRFLEISSSEISLFSLSLSKDLITNPLAPFPFAFARLNALQAAVIYSNSMVIQYNLNNITD